MIKRNSHDSHSRARSSSRKDERSARNASARPQRQSASYARQSARGTYAEQARKSEGSSSRKRVSTSSREGQDSSSYSRRAGSARYAQKLQEKRRVGRIVRRALIACLVLIVSGAVGAFAYVNMINGNLSRGLSGDLSNVLVKTNLTKEPFYMLLCGTDQSIQRDQTGETSGTYRTDSMILTRIDPVEKKVTLISLPRDTKITVEGHGEQKLNAAYAFGGSELAVKTVANLSGVNISHFALVDMDGMKEVIDALGGVEVDVPMEINDADAGGHLDAGPQTLTGDQALILARSRHAYDEYGDGDAYRAANQRLVLQAIAKKILSSDVVTIANTVTKLSEYVQTDLSVNDIVGLAQAMQGLDSSTGIYTASMPTESVYEGKVWYEEVVSDAWKAMMTRVNKGLPPTENTEVDKNTGVVLSNAGEESATDDSSPATPSSASSKDGSIVVRNGSGKSGVAKAVADKITAAGYSVTDTGNADAFNYKTSLVVYADSADSAEAEEIAKVVGGGATAKMNNGSYSMSGDFLVVIGSSYSG